MLLPTIQASCDFVSARLHGLMAKAVRGEALENLARSATEELLLRNLRNLGIECTGRQEFHEFIYARELGELNSMARMLDNRGAAYYLARESCVYFENLKTALHSRFSRSDMDSGYVFISAPNMPDFDGKALESARDTREFVRRLPLYGELKRDRLASIVRELDETRNLMLADSMVDHAFYDEVWSALDGLNSVVGSEARRLVGIEIDILNLNMLMRNARTYHFDASVMSGLWLDRGCVLGKRKLTELAGRENVQEIRTALGGKYGRILESVEGTELYLSENALWKYLWHEARHSFFMMDEPALAIAAFPFLAHFETLNLGRIYEGVYFGIPSQNILEMMIGD